MRETITGTSGEAANIADTASAAYSEMADLNNDDIIPEIASCVQSVIYVILIFISALPLSVTSAYRTDPPVTLPALPKAGFRPYIW